MTARDEIPVRDIDHFNNSVDVAKSAVAKPVRETLHARFRFSRGVLENNRKCLLCVEIARIITGSGRCG